MLDTKETLAQLNLGVKYKLGMNFINFKKYVSVLITIIVIILGALNGGIG